MTASPETGPVVLLYGCAECNWIYSPQTPEETSKTYLLMAQFKFEQHVCSTYGDQSNVGLATLWYAKWRMVLDKEVSYTSLSRSSLRWRSVVQSDDSGCLPGMAA